jgi:peptide deformylase
MSHDTLTNETLPLVTGKDTPVLVTKTALVADPLAPEIQELLPRMIATMHKEVGVGLAATQIGLPLRLAVAEVEGKEHYWINPEITSLSEEKIIFEEGCLSLPGQYFPIIRSKSLTLKYTNEKGLPKKLRATGFLAVVIQHEVDHLEGILICNRFQKQTKLRETKIYGRID